MPCISDHFDNSETYIRLGIYISSGSDQRRSDITVIVFGGRMQWSPSPLQNMNEIICNINGIIMKSLQNYA